MIGFDQESYSVNERDGNALIRVSVISGTPSTDLKVEFETFDITAACELIFFLIRLCILNFRGILLATKYIGSLAIIFLILFSPHISWK